ncbi:MAG: CoxG family protein [Candidatus Binatia bacterium]
MQFEKEIEILNSKEKVWQFLWDIDRFITCVPGCREAAVVEAGKRYTAKMVEKVGPFRLEIPMQIEVLQSEEMSTIKAQATGSDNRIGSRIKVELEVHLKGDGANSVLSLVASVDILGKLAALGHSIIKRKAGQVMEEFAQAVKARLEEHPAVT